MCICNAAAVCDSTLEAVERDVRFSLQVVLSFRLSLKVQGGYGWILEFMICKSHGKLYFCFDNILHRHLKLIQRVSTDILYIYPGFAVLGQ